MCEDSLSIEDIIQQDYPKKGLNNRQKDIIAMAKWSVNNNRISSSEYRAILKEQTGGEIPFRSRLIGG